MTVFICGHGWQGMEGDDKGIVPHFERKELFTFLWELDEKMDTTLYQALLNHPLM